MADQPRDSEASMPGPVNGGSRCRRPGAARLAGYCALAGISAVGVGAVFGTVIGLACSGLAATAQIIATIAAIAVAGALARPFIGRTPPSH